MSSTDLSSHTGRHNKQFFFTVQRGTPKIYLKQSQLYHPASHTPNQNIHPHISFTGFFFPSPLTLFFTSLKTFFDFLGHFFFLDTFFSSGTLFLFFFSGHIYLTSIRGSPPHTHNSVDLRTRLPGCVDHQVCSTYVSTPQGHPSGPSPGCYL